MLLRLFVSWATFCLLENPACFGISTRRLSNCGQLRLLFRTIVLFILRLKQAERLYLRRPPMRRNPTGRLVYSSANLLGYLGTDFHISLCLKGLVGEEECALDRAIHSGSWADKQLLGMKNIETSGSLLAKNEKKNFGIWSALFLASKRVFLRFFQCKRTHSTMFLENLPWYFQV